jgi:hypothetical protein
MRRIAHRSVLVILAMGMFLTICQPAHAYIDAGSGSYLLQILFATFFGMAFTVKSTFANLKAAILRRGGKGGSGESSGV